jgi:hypothetical protein
VAECGLLIRLLIFARGPPMLVCPARGLIL